MSDVRAVLNRIEAAQAIPGGDMTSLEFLQAIYRNASIPLPTRMRAAMAALQYEHPKLAVTAIVPDGGNFADRLDRAIARSSRSRQVQTIDAKAIEIEQKAIEHKPVEHSASELRRERRRA